MKQLSWFNKIVYFLNILLTILTFAGYLLPFLAPRMFPLLSVLTLGLPVLFTLNFLFFIYWILQLKKHFLLSAVVLLIGFGFITKWIKFSETLEESSDKDFTVMSFNVRRFNAYDWIKDKNVESEISSFISEKNPTILCVQEYAKNNVDVLNRFKYKFVPNKNKGNAIYSNYKIIDQGFYKFENSGNNFVFADILIDLDTVRFYSVHLQSIKITKDIAKLEAEKGLDQKKSELILKRMSDAFSIQQEQAIILNQHISECNHPVFICGDLNNSAFSYVYSQVKGNLNDAFEKAGIGFGKTYTFKYFPFRIDYLFSDKSYKVKEFNTFDTVELSDHYPIMARYEKVK